MARARVTTIRTGDVIAFNGQEYATLPAHDSDRDQGHWICVTHDKDFPNNLSASSHEYDEREHLVGWWCGLPGHGPEVP